MKKYIKTVILVTLILTSCVDEIDFVEEVETFDSALVVEATITNEFKFQEIILSKTYNFEEDGPNPESNAQVKLIKNGSEAIVFTETEPGIYLSEFEFSAQQNVDYQLKITTNNGRSYTSNTNQLTQITQIDELYAERITNDQGKNGMAIFVDSFDPSGNSKYYKYEYEETYKIISPKWVPKEIVVLDNATCEVDLIDRVEDVQVCYRTDNSTAINLFDTSPLSEDRVSNHEVRFINSEDYIISYRYSILVKQIVQSFEAHSFYKTLKDLSEDGSLLSHIQPGNIVSNIVSTTNSNEIVVGFFEVSTVSEKRLYFNYEDFYPNEGIPDFPVICDPVEHSQFSPNPNMLVCGTLISELNSDRVVYHNGASKVADTTFFEDGSIIIDTITRGPFNMVLKPCGDCTAIGETTVPDFWID